MASNKKDAQPSKRMKVANKTTKSTKSTKTSVKEVKKEEKEMAANTAAKENVNTNEALDNVVEMANNGAAAPETTTAAAPEAGAGRPGFLARVKGWFANHKVGVAFASGAATGAAIGVGGKIAYDHYNTNKTLIEED